jgi:hypothetical protein
MNETRVDRSGLEGSIAHLAAAPRCGAKTRRGTSCQAHAIKDKRRCRLHGGLSTGPRTLEGRERIRQARTITGFYSASAIAARREARANYCRLRTMLGECGGYL